ncbi:LytR/AlgR family response regulator transcription factor [Rariglobus hedericola]|uniref:Response regulator transcription factor n=1 Tax=Rariglobus hedericola TaxID=2597822 RepID=A0A556QKM3_9BACT|nr:LytTR family DNA-binding domain-containing protein [Rariglobus hedericola]TSJ77171.1 response regulator transcription factor [Rariglobus hedericola]
MIRALLIEDEAPAREDFRRLLAAHPEVVIVGDAASVATARTRLATSDYDLVFLDIQLIGGNGFDLVPHVRPEARIIFVTAYDQHALRAFEVNALDYLLKPVAPARIAQALARLGAPAQQPVNRPPTLTIDDRLLLKLGSGNDRFVRLADIQQIVSCENYSEVHLAGGEHVLVRKTLATWEAELPSEQFGRVHRTTIVNVAHVTRIERVTEATSHVFLDGATEPVTASYRYLPTLRETLARHRRR